MDADLWTEAALGDVVKKWIVGSTPPRTSPEFFVQEGGVPWAKAEDVRGGVLDHTAEQLSEMGGQRMRLIRKGSVLVTTAGTIGNVALAGRPMYCNQAVQALSFREDQVLPLYGYYFLRLQRPLLERLAAKAVIPSISKGKLWTIPVRYPPLQTQRDMVARMREPEELLQKAERFQALLREYLRALTVREARGAGRFAPIGELLEEPPLTGLRAKRSPTGNGIPLVNKPSGNGGCLRSLEDCQRVQATERQISRYRIRPMDLLLRGSVSKGGARGFLAGELPEDALVGGNLIRLRLKPGCSAGWLLAWLSGPEGDQLYVEGRLQKQLLEQYLVPLPKDQEGFSRRFDLYLSLEDRAERLARGAEALVESILRRVFARSAGEGAAFQSQADVRLDSSLNRLTEPMNLFLRELSQSQRDLYYRFLRLEGGEPVHTLLRRGQDGGTGLQDALATFALLEQFGLVERESPQNIPLYPGGIEPRSGGARYIADHNGQLISIDAYKPTEDIFGENAYAAGAGEDTKL